MFKHFDSSTPESFFKENEENRNNLYAADAACARILITAYNYAAEHYETIIDKNCHDTIKDVSIVNARKQKKKKIIKAAFEGRLKDVFPENTMSYKHKVLDDFCRHVVKDINSSEELVEDLRKCILYHNEPFLYCLHYNRFCVFDDDREQTRLVYFKSSTPQSYSEEPEFHPNRRILEAAMYAFINRESILNKYWSGHYEIYEEGHEFAGMRKWVPDSRYNKLNPYTRRYIIEGAFEGHNENTDVSVNRRQRAIKQFCEAVATELNDQTIADDLYKFIKGLHRRNDISYYWLNKDSIWPYLSY